ncbi:thioesterase family protein [Lentinula edodes]|uniref:Thioesterase family protein n=1 Tax=Lentinula edodes TaxID=5353 RepID=A0A1Q3EHR3_LENED|nr:thioesterase family protein [Lentinula edodes]
MHSGNLKSLRREDFGYTLSCRTRCKSSDFNTYLIESCGQNPQESLSIGLVVSSWCQFFAPLSFPDILDLCLRVKKLGDSSVTQKEQEEHCYTSRCSRWPGSIGLKRKQIVVQGLPDSCRALACTSRRLFRQKLTHAKPQNRQFSISSCTATAAAGCNTVYYNYRYKPSKSHVDAASHLTSLIMTLHDPNS